MGFVLPVAVLVRLVALEATFRFGLPLAALRAMGLDQQARRRALPPRCRVLLALAFALRLRESIGALRAAARVVSLGCRARRGDRGGHPAAGGLAAGARPRNQAGTRRWSPARCSAWCTPTWCASRRWRCSRSGGLCARCRQPGRDGGACWAPRRRACSPNCTRRCCARRPAAPLLVFVDVMKELPATLVLRPSTATRWRWWPPAGARRAPGENGAALAGDRGGGPAARAAAVALAARGAPPERLALGVHELFDQLAGQGVERRFADAHAAEQFERRGQPAVLARIHLGLGGFGRRDDRLLRDRRMLAQGRALAVMRQTSWPAAVCSPKNAPW